jgi:HNH endonuclease
MPPQVADPRAHALARTRRYGDCLLFVGALNHGGYGIVSVRNRKLAAHRLIVGLENIPPGHEVDHVCRRPSCVRPDHLRVVPVSEHRSRHSREAWARRRRR